MREGGRWSSGKLYLCKVKEERRGGRLSSGKVNDFTIESEVREGGRWSRGCLILYNFKEERDGGRWSSGKEYVPSPKVKWVREEGR